MNAARELEPEIRALDARLKPIASRPVDITDPGWFEKLSALKPLQQAGIARSEMAAVVLKLVNMYEQSSAVDRQEIRDLFDRYRAFSWGATLGFRPTTPEGFRQHLLLFSIDDQGRDSRDAILALQRLCAEAETAGVDIRQTLNDVAALSSDRDKYGMRSTRQQLIGAAQRIGNSP